MGTITKTIAGTPVAFSVVDHTVTATPEGGETVTFNKVGHKYRGKFPVAEGEASAMAKLMNGRFICNFGQIGYTDSFSVALNEIGEAAHAA